MKKIESTFINMLVSLLMVCLVSAGLLAGVYELTKADIALAEKNKQENALKGVLPEFDTIKTDSINGAPVFKAFKNGVYVGAATITSDLGFSDQIVVMVGIDNAKNIVNYEVLSQKETPGLGTKCVDWFKEQINGKSISTDFKVTKDGGDVDAITAATITSRAFLDAVKKAENNFTGDTDAITSATEVEMEVSNE
jgi:electron transport complex protein RnfG